jgi:phosphatidate phosphatase APP1
MFQVVDRITHSLLNIVYLHNKTMVYLIYIYTSHAVDSLFKFFIALSFEAIMSFVSNSLSELLKLLSEPLCSNSLPLERILKHKVHISLITYFSS